MQDGSSWEKSVNKKQNGRTSFENPYFLPATQPRLIAKHPQRIAGSRQIKQIDCVYG